MLLYKQHAPIATNPHTHLGEAGYFRPNWNLNSSPVIRFRRAGHTILRTILAPTSPDRDVAAADLLLRGHRAAPIAREPTAAFGPLYGNTQGLYSGAIIRQGQLHDVVSFDARFRAVGINLDRVRLAGELGLARGPQSDT